MSNVANLRPEPEAPKVSGLALLREPFPDNQISKLPKETKQQIDARKADIKLGIRCKLCGSWHHKDAIHLDYVGHAALTDRLLDADLQWDWEPLSYTQQGLPALDKDGGLWIKLTVCGKTRLGYGCADGKQGGDAMKELIGDALRNAAMRFGAALELWHKGVLHLEEPEPLPTAEDLAIKHLRACAVDRQIFKDAWDKNKANWQDVMDDDAFRRVFAIAKEISASLATQAAPAPPLPVPAPPAPTLAKAAGFDLDDEIPEFA